MPVETSGREVLPDDYQELLQRIRALQRVVRSRVPGDSEYKEYEKIKALAEIVQKAHPDLVERINGLLALLIKTAPELDQEVA